MKSVVLAIVLSVVGCQSQSHSLNRTPVTNWTQCSVVCRCGLDEQSRVYAKCYVNSLDENTELNLPEGVYSLSLANNAIRTLSSGGLRKLHNLSELSLANNSITVIGIHAFQGMQRLHTLDLQYNNIQKWDVNPEDCLPSLEVLNIARNPRLIPSKDLLQLPMLREVRGVTWSRYCTECDLIKFSGNNKSFSDTELDDYDDASANSGDYNDDEMSCTVTRESFYLHHNEVTYSVSLRFVDQGFAPQCFCNVSTKCYEYDVIRPFFRQLYNVPRKLFHFQYALGAVIICLNLVVLLVILTSKPLRNNISFTLVASMSLSDLLIGIHGVAIAEFNFFNDEDVIVPRRLMESSSDICMYIGMVFTTGQITAVINSLLLTVERYLVIVYYQQRRSTMNKRILLICLVVVWVAAIVFASLPLIGLKNFKYHKWFQCTMPFHTGNNIQETSDITLSIAAAFAFLYLVSLALYLMIFCYARKSSVQFGIKREARVARKIAILVCSNFILFTLPTVILLVYVYSFPDILLNMVETFTSMRLLLVVGSWVPVTLFNVNSLANPFLYPFRHSRFKKEVRSFHLRLRSSVSEGLHPVIATAQELSMRTSALRQHFRLHLNSFGREADNSVRVELREMMTNRESATSM